MPKTSIRDVYGPDYDFFMSHKGEEGQHYSTPPLVVLDWLRTCDLPGRLRDMIRVMLNYRYSFAMAVCPLRTLAEEMNLHIRQTRYWLAELKKRKYVEVMERPGRASMISIAPLIKLIKEQFGWQETEQPAPVVETLAEVAPEPDLSWLEEEESEEEAPIPDDGPFWDWNRIKDMLASDPYISRVAFTNHLATTEGVDWEDNILIVECDSGILRRIEASYKEKANLLVLDTFAWAMGVEFRERKSKKKPKPPGPIEQALTLVAATVGV